MQDALGWVIAGLVLVGVLTQVGLLLNVHKMLGRLASIRRDLVESRDSSTAAGVSEAVTQLQSLAVSLDRIALRCDDIKTRLDDIAARAPAGGGADVGPAVEAIRAGLAELRGPVAQIRDLLGRTEVERLADEVRRSLYTRGYDTVAILTDLATVPRTGDAKVQVEVAREGVKAKGTVLVRDGAAIETKISPTYEMFP